MTSIDQWIDNTVQTLKNSGKFNDMVFLKEYLAEGFDVDVVGDNQIGGNHDDRVRVKGVIGFVYPSYPNQKEG